jgi:hypothetical protein
MCIRYDQIPAEIGRKKMAEILILHSHCIQSAFLSIYASLHSL